MSTTEKLDLIFSALGDTTRRDILARLVNEDASIGDIANNYTMSLPAISKHIAILEKSGLVSLRKEGRSKTVRLEFEALRTAAIWLETLGEATLDWDALEEEIDNLSL